MGSPSLGSSQTMKERAVSVSYLNRGFKRNLAGSSGHKGLLALRKPRNLPGKEAEKSTMALQVLKITWGPNGIILKRARTDSISVRLQAW